MDLEHYYETCVLISMKSSNNQSEIDKMDFWKFNNLMVYFSKYLEKLEGTGNSETSTEDSSKNEFSKYMDSAKSMLKTPKLSGMKLPKK